MKRAEAVSFLKEISAACGDASAISLSESKTTDASIGYQLRIKPPFDGQQVKDVIDKHRLAMKEENGEVIIYQPKQ